MKEWFLENAWWIIGVASLMFIIWVFLRSDDPLQNFLKLIVLVIGFGLVSGLIKLLTKI